MTELGLEVDEVAPRLKCKRRKVFMLLQSGELQRVNGQPGKKTLVTVASVEAYIRKLLPEAPPKPRRSEPKPKPAQKFTPKDLERRRQEIERRRAALKGRPDVATTPARRASAAR